MSFAVLIAIGVSLLATGCAFFWIRLATGYRSEDQLEQVVQSRRSSFDESINRLNKN
ncbi:MAG: hypothetical protein ACOVS5_15940 [Oligoflexus sp.]|jgi:hypothetical protein